MHDSGFSVYGRVDSAVTGNAIRNQVMVIVNPSMFSAIHSWRDLSAVQASAGMLWYATGSGVNALLTVLVLRVWRAAIAIQAIREKLQFLPMTEHHNKDLGGEQHDDESLSGSIPSIDAVYAELRLIASAYIRHERKDHTLQPTALVNEAYLKLVNSPDRHANGRARFLGVAARAMRQVLVDHARAKSSSKRGGMWAQISLSGLSSADGENSGVDTLALDNALERLAEFHTRPARVVELRFFGGLTIAEAAEVIGVSHGTVESDWTFAKAWLRRELEGEM